jgi:uncharacterized protein (DUF2062 family)
MAKKILKRFLPNPHKLQKSKSLKIFGDFLLNPNLWHLNRYSVATATSIGLFVSYIPFPGHMLTAALLAIIFRANLPLSVAMVWVSNPFSIFPMFYFAYKVGCFVLGRTPTPFHFHVSFEWLLAEINTIGIPLIVGSLVCGTILAIIGNIAIRIFWRYSVTKAWKERAKKRQSLPKKHFDSLLF